MKPNRTENSFVPVFLRGPRGAARESGAAGEKEGQATQVAAPFLSGQPLPATVAIGKKPNKPVENNNLKASRTKPNRTEY